MEFDENALRHDSSKVRAANILGPAFDPLRGRLEQIAPSGFSLIVNLTVRGYEYLEVTYPEEWQQEYDQKHYYATDPVLIWGLFNTGEIRWSEIPIPDLRGFMRRAAQTAGLKYGAVFSRRVAKRTCILSMSHPDREFGSVDIAEVGDLFTIAVDELSPSKGLSDAELAVLQCLANDLNVAQTADKLGVSVSAVKGRLTTARNKMDCKTNYQLVAAAMRASLIE